jgi:hypothetical protein
MEDVQASLTLLLRVLQGSCNLLNYLQIIVPDLRFRKTC